MSLDSIYRNGIQRVWTEDYDSQCKYTDLVRQTRNMQGIDFKKINAFFIPNDDYVKQYFDIDQNTVFIIGRISAFGIIALLYQFIMWLIASLALLVSTHLNIYRQRKQKTGL